MGTTFERNNIFGVKPEFAAYTLSTFVASRNVEPIFYEETIFNNERLTFCFYFDNNDNKFKIQTHTYSVTDRKKSTATLEELSRSTSVVSHGSELRKWSSIEGNWFVKDHLDAMYFMIGDNPISKVISNLCNILSRITQFDYTNSVLGASLSGEYKIISGRYIFINDEVRVTFPIPTTVKIHSQCKDVLGKQRESSARLVISKNAIGFDNINFVITANYLLKQYKLWHNVVDYIKKLFYKDNSNLALFKSKSVKPNFELVKTV